MLSLRDHRHYAVLSILSLGLTVLFTDGESPVLGEESGGPRAVSPESEAQGTPIPKVVHNCVKGCDDVCGSGKVNDECGVCGGSGPGECGCDLGVKKDKCGVCGGDDSSCADCLGVPNGLAEDYGCGCGRPAPGECGCDLAVKDLGCGCGKPAPGECGCTACPEPAPPPPPAQNGCPVMADTTCSDLSFGDGPMQAICVANPFVSGAKLNSVRFSYLDGTANSAFWNPFYISKGNTAWYSYNDPAAIKADLEASLQRYSEYCFVCGCYRVNGCFAPGSRIAMADGSFKPIEEIRAGDMVFNPVTGKPAAVDRVIEGAEPLPLIEFGYGVTLGRVSQQHPVLTTLGIKRAAELTAADAVIGADGQAHQLAVVRRLAVEDGQMVLNLIINQESADPKDHMLLADDMVTGDFAAQSALSGK